MTGCHVASRRPALDCDDEAQKPLVNRFEEVAPGRCAGEARQTSVASVEKLRCAAASPRTKERLVLTQAAEHWRQWNGAHGMR